MRDSKMRPRPYFQLYYDNFYKHELEVLACANAGDWAALIKSQGYLTLSTRYKDLPGKMAGLDILICSHILSKLWSMESNPEAINVYAQTLSEAPAFIKTTLIPMLASTPFATLLSLDSPNQTLCGIKL